MATSDVSISRVEAITRQLREAIFEGRYSPGMRLRELALAKELSVSQATIREALRGLEHAGLVSKEANRGSTVTRLSPKEIRERVSLRALLETVAAQSAATRMTDEHLAELNSRAAALDSAVHGNRYYEAAQADLEFHRYIWQCSGNATLCDMLELIVVPLFAFISILRSQGVQKLEAVVASHAPLVESLRSRDPEQIREAFTTGATSAYRTFLDDGDERALAGALGLLELSR